jgi:hypothetical protein
MHLQVTVELGGKLSLAPLTAKQSSQPHHQRP